MRAITIITALVLLAGVAVGQSPAPQAPANTPTAAAAASSPVPDGTTIRVEAKNTIESKKAKVGDPLKLEVVQDVRTADGRTVLPKKSKIVATVSQVAPAGKGEAKLSIIATSATLPSGQSVPLTAIMLGNIQPMAPMSNLSMAGASMGQTVPQQQNVQEFSSGLAGVKLQKDDKFGSVLVSERNFVLQDGTMFDLRQVVPQAPAAQPAAPAAQPTPSSK